MGAGIEATAADANDAGSSWRRTRMDDMLPKSKARKDPEIAAAEWLLQDTPAEPVQAPQPIPSGSAEDSPGEIALVEPVEEEVPAQPMSRAPAGDQAFRT